jgi:hypothetical protein
MWNWLKKVGGRILGGVNWLGQNIGKPLVNFAKNIPVVGDVVRAADPLLSTVSKGMQYAEDVAKDVPAAKRRAKPTGEDLKNAISSGINTIGKVKNIFSPSGGVGGGGPVMEPVD